MKNAAPEPHTVTLYHLSTLVNPCNLSKSSIPAIDANPLTPVLHSHHGRFNLPPHTPRFTQPAGYCPASETARRYPHTAPARLLLG